MLKLTVPMLHVLKPLPFINVTSLQSKSAIATSLIVVPRALVPVSIRICHRTVSMFDPKLPLASVHSSILVSSYTVAMRQILLPLALIRISICKIDRSHSREHIIFPIALKTGSIRQNQSSLVRQAILPRADVPASIRGVGALTLSMAAIPTEGALVSVPVAIDRDPLTFHLVIAPVARVPSTPITVDDLASTMFETVLELARVNVSGQGSQHPLAIHLALRKVTLVNVAILELEAAGPVVIRGYDRVN